MALWIWCLDQVQKEWEQDQFRDGHEVLIVSYIFENNYQILEIVQKFEKAGFFLLCLPPGFLPVVGPDWAGMVASDTWRSPAV